MTHTKTFLIISCAIFLLSFNSVSAANLYLFSEERSFVVGDEFNVDVKVNTGEDGVNATEAKIVFPNNILEILSFSKQDSVFDFWLDGPNILNETGEISFIGGTPKGVSGSALQILSIKFKAKGTGSADITFTDSVVTASDGKGTNILSVIEGINVGIGTKTIPVEPAPIPEPEPVEKPKEVVREPVVVGTLPSKPQLTVPLYSDSSRWYNHLGQTIVFWDVPDDAVKVATRIDNDPYGGPQDAGDIERVFLTGKNFGPLSEGVWYMHVQFKNNVGWGEIASHKVSLDMTPPVAFEIKIDNEISSNPSPEIQYQAYDSLSGVAQYHVFIDGKGPTKTDLSTMVLPPQKPGKHLIRVKAVDFAGNGVEDELEFEVLALATPTIDFVIKSVSQGEYVFASGKTIPESFVDVRLFNKDGNEVFLGKASSDALGNWEIVIEEPLARGTYSITAVARDMEGAVSYATEAQTLKIKAKTIVSIGSIDLGWFEISIIVALIVVSTLSIIAWLYVSSRKKRQAYSAITSRDIDSLSDLMVNDLRQFKTWLRDPENTVTPKSRADAEYLLQKMEGNISKIKNYLLQQINKLK